MTKIALLDKSKDETQFSWVKFVYFFELFDWDKELTMLESPRDIFLFQIS